MYISCITNKFSNSNYFLKNRTNFCQNPENTTNSYQKDLSSKNLQAKMTPEAERCYLLTKIKLRKPTKISAETIDKNLGLVRDDNDWKLDGLNELYRLQEQDWNTKFAKHNALLSQIKEPKELNIIHLDNEEIFISKTDAEMRNRMFLYNLKEIAADCDILNTLKECENLTFDSPNLNLMKDHYDESVVYDLGLRYTVVANNTAQAKGSATVINEIPEIFKDLDEKELITKLDNLPIFLEPNKINLFSIGDKYFSAKKIGIGYVNDIYLISDKFGNKVCFRSSKSPYCDLRGQDTYSEFAIAQEAYKAGVVDVPKLYMANPTGKFVNDGQKQGGWQIVEYISNDTPPVKKGLKFFDWLNDKGLIHFDLNPGSIINNRIVDMGGIQDITDVGIDHYAVIMQGYNSGETTSSLIQKINLLNK